MLQISVALNRDNKRNLQLYANDGQQIEIIVYREDGDDTPLTTEVTNPRMNFCEGFSMDIPIGLAFVVPDKYDRTPYTLTADIDGVRTTLAHGVVIIKGAHGWPYWRWDYGGPWGWSWLP